MVKTLQILREAGFFQKYSSLTDDELLEQIHHQRIERYSKIFGHHYEPERELDDQNLALEDDNKMFNFDFEADVCADNKVYIDVLKIMDKTSGRQNIITDFSEEWQTEFGPIKVSYKINGGLKEYNPEYGEDWLDQNFVDHVLAEISNITQEQFHICLGPNEEWMGQDPNYIRLTPNERKILETKLEWVFFDDFLKSMRNE